VKVLYVFDDTVIVTDEFELDPGDATDVRNAKSRAELRDILDPLIAEHALSEPRPTLGSHKRTIDFGLEET